MNHRPFEEWLLNHTALNSGQKRELDSHLRTCGYCAALLKTENVLQDVRMVAPANGFANRFQNRLAAYKAADRKRRWLGLIVLVLTGFTAFLWFASPYLSSLFASPAGWITALVEWGVFLLTTLLASLEAGAVILDVLGGFVPPFAWMVFVSGVAGLSLLWSVSIWRFAQRGVPQGA